MKNTAAATHTQSCSWPSGTNATCWAPDATGQSYLSPDQKSTSDAVPAKKSPQTRAPGRSISYRSLRAPARLSHSPLSANATGKRTHGSQYLPAAGSRRSAPPEPSAGAGRRTRPTPAASAGRRRGSTQPAACWHFGKARGQKL